MSVDISHLVLFFTFLVATPAAGVDIMILCDLTR